MTRAAPSWWRPYVSDRARAQDAMKTLARERNRIEIVQRLTALRPESARRWGRMSAHQMVCHLNDSFRMMTGKRPVSSATGVVQQTIMKWIVLYGPLRWPSGRNGENGKLTLK